MICQAAVFAAQFHFPVIFQRSYQLASGKTGAAAVFIKRFSFFIRHSIHQFGGYAKEKKVASCQTVFLQAGNRSGTQGFAAGNDNHIIGHFSYMKPAILRFFILYGKKGFCDKVKIQLGEKEPFCQVPESAFHLFPDQGSLFLRPIVQPVAFNRMDNADAYTGLPAGKGRIHPCKMILYHAVFLIPGGLIEDGGRIVPLCLTVHAVPGKMMDTQGHSQRRLPVSRQLMSPEIKIPVGYAVQLAEHAGTAKLMGCGLSLFRRGVFPPVTEHIDARHLKTAVRTHGFSQSIGLGGQRRLLHHMSGEHDIVIPAPVSDGIREGGGKSLRHKIMIMIPGNGHLILRKLPDKLRH